MDLLNEALKLAEELSATTIKLKETEMKLGEEQNEGNRLRARIEDIKKEQEIRNKEQESIYTKLINEISILKGEKHQEPIIMEENKNDTAIIITAYNESRFIKKQVDLIRRFHKDPVDIIIVDNSDDPSAVEQIKYYNKELGCLYLKTNASSKNGSESHSFSLGLSYHVFKNNYRFILYIDFDCFPIREFSIKEMLNDKIMTGVGQNKDGIEYFWPGFVLFDNGVIDRNLIDFSCNHDLRLDTGGNLHSVISTYGKDKCPFIPEIHVQNPNFNKSMYNFYADINNGGFMHFIGGSGWNKEGDLNHDERISSLLNILEEKTRLL